MQDYAYSVFSTVAIAIHLILNFKLLMGRGVATAHAARYRGFLFGVLAYYLTDAAWGMFAGLKWMSLWYVDTIFFFLSLVAFVVLWGRFVIDYLNFGKFQARVVAWSGHALLAFNLLALAINPFNGCFFIFDGAGRYHTGYLRDPAFFLLVAFDILVATLVLFKALGSRDAVRRRSMMVILFCTVMAAAIVLQVVWPLTPFTALGCLVGNCFFHVFVIQDEQAAKYMDELEAALARAQAAEKARSTFFSIVSHDIRTPLNAILGYVDLLRFGMQSQEEKDEALESVKASCKTLLRLVNDVLDLSKADAGKIMFHPQPVRLDRLTGDVFASFRLSAAQNGVELVNRTAGVPTVLLDGQRLRQILFNLVGNAVRFTRNGSVTVDATYVDTRLEISVSDTGVGIPAEMLPRIFSPFSQVLDPSHAVNVADGTGLGLLICKSFVEAMGGKIAAESECGKGTTITCIIPGVAASGEHVKPDAGAKPPVGTKVLPKHVLVVDDSAVNRKVLSALLKRCGIDSVDLADNGKEALVSLNLAMAGGNQYDLVLSDYWMPEMNGLEFVQDVRADSRFDHLPVFAVTADTEFYKNPGSELFTDILLKPLTYDTLVDVLDSIPARM